MHAAAGTAKILYPHAHLIGGGVPQQMQGKQNLKSPDGSGARGGIHDIQYTGPSHAIGTGHFSYKKADLPGAADKDTTRHTKETKNTLGKCKETVAKAGIEKSPEALLRIIAETAKRGTATRGTTPKTTQQRPREGKLPAMAQTVWEAEREQEQGKIREATRKETILLINGFMTVGASEIPPGFDLLDEEGRNVCMKVRELAEGANKFEELKSERDDLKKQLNKCQMQTKAVQVTIDDVRRELRENDTVKKQEIARLKSDNDWLRNSKKQQTSQSPAKVAELTRRISALEKELSQTKVDSDQQKKEAATALRSAKRLIEATRTECNELRSLLERQKQSLSAEMDQISTSLRGRLSTIFASNRLRLHDICTKFRSTLGGVRPVMEDCKQLLTLAKTKMFSAWTREAIEDKAEAVLSLRDMIIFSQQRQLDDLAEIRQQLGDMYRAEQDKTERERAVVERMIREERRCRRLAAEIIGLSESKDIGLFEVLERVKKQFADPRP